jgi:uncharacterized protein YkwD
MTSGPRSILRRALAGGAALAFSVSFAVRVYGDASSLVWKTATQSPSRLTAAAHTGGTSLTAICGASDAALAEVAARAARRQLEGAALLGAEELAFSLRAAGDPHVWPRAWSIAGPVLDEDDMAQRVKAWGAPWNTLGVRRCGVARATGPDGTTVVAAVAVDAIADMATLPTTARVGQWLTLNGTMLVPASAAKVVLLGPRGAPRMVVASLTDGRIRSTFSVDQPGPWLVQVLATVSTGPRPVLEAMIFAGTTPPAQFVANSAPGEAAGQGAKDDDDAMLRMMNAARASEKRPPLARDAALDKLARTHSEEMRKARMIGHDIGRGEPTARLKAAGLRVRVAGENVASASSLEHAHRALWASPSHRGNLLLQQFTRAGVAVVKGPDGMVWVTEIFAGS